MSRRATWSKTILAAAGAALLLAAVPLSAGFAGTDVFIPASARQAGIAPSQFYSTLWITNLSTASPANVQLKFLQRNESNTSPITVPVTVAPGETKKYENAVQTIFGLSDVSGAIRIQSDREVLASSRTYNLPPGADIRDANGLFFTGIPQSLAIGNGESSQLQGVSQNGSEDFRYNYGFVETAGYPVTVRIIVRNADGSVAGTKDYPVLAFEAKQFAVTDAAPALETINGRIDASVVSGSGAVLLYGTAIANGSLDSIGFEMSYRNTLLSAGVSSLNGLTGAVTLAPGANVTFAPSGNTITINATGGGGASGVTTLNGLSGTVGLVNGGGISITPSGNNLAIAATGSSLTLPYSGTATTTSGNGAFNVSTPGTAASSSAIVGTVSSASAGNLSAGVQGTNSGTGAGGVGVLGTSSGGTGVLGVSSAYAIRGQQGTPTGFAVSSGKVGVWGDSVDGYGICGTSTMSVGVTGASATQYGVQALGNAAGVSGAALFAYNGASGGYAATFSGTVQVLGAMSKSSGTFKIDHPLDPENKYLYHSFVESPDMKNIYDGVVVLDARGEAVVSLPDWFSALNKDFRYQLTCIGGYAPVYVSQEVVNDTFRIAGGKPGLKVSWQVTGVRQDAWANAHRVKVEELKDAVEKGHYIHPEVFGQPEEKSVDWARDPERMKELKAQRDRLAPPTS